MSNRPLCGDHVPFCCCAYEFQPTAKEFTLVKSEFSIIIRMLYKLSWKKENLSLLVVYSIILILTNFLFIFRFWQHSEFIKLPFMSKCARFQSWKVYSKDYSLHTIYIWIGFPISLHRREVILKMLARVGLEDWLHTKCPTYWAVSLWIRNKVTRLFTLKT